MRPEFATLLLGALALGVLSTPAGAQVKPPEPGFPAAQPIDPAKARAYKPPLAADGHPDLEGIWQPHTSGAA